MWINNEISFVVSNKAVSGSGVFVAFQITLEDTTGGSSKGDLYSAPESLIRLGTVN